jgi:hypothetical protein
MCDLTLIRILPIQRRQLDVSPCEFFGLVVIPEFVRGQFQRHHIALVRTAVYTRWWLFALLFGLAGRSLGAQKESHHLL